MPCTLDLKLFNGSLDFIVRKKKLFSSVLLEEGAVPGDIKEKSGEAISFLKELKDKYGIKSARILFPFNLCLSSMIELPLVRRADIESALVFEMEKFLPLPVDHYLSCYRILEKRKSGTRMLVLCVKKEMISVLNLLIGEAGIQVSSAKCDFMDRLSSSLRSIEKRDFIFVSVEKNGFAFAVFRNRLCTGLKHGRDLSLIEREVGSAVQLHGISDIFLSGKADEGALSSFESVQEAKVARRARAFDFEFLESGIGSGVERNYRIYAGIAAAVSAAMIIAGFFIPVYRDYGALKRIDSNIAKVKGNASGVLEDRKQLETAKEKLKTLNELQEKRTIPLRVLAELSNILPNDAWITGLVIDDKGFVELKGLAGNAAQLVEVLEKSGLFKNAEFSAPILTSGDKTRFSIKMELEK